MKKIVVLIAMFIGINTVLATSLPVGTQIQCQGQSDMDFIVNILDLEVPRVAPYDDATITFGGDANNWKWMQLEYYNAGDMLSQYIFNILNGGKLVVTETIKFSAGGCGRGSCDPTSRIKKIISAKLIMNNGQEYVYSCKKIK